MRLLPIAGVLAAALALSTPAYADSESEADLAYERGAKLFYEGDYGAAILEFRQAYALAPDPIFLINTALAQTRLGLSREALQTTEQILSQHELEDDVRILVDARRVALNRVLLAKSFDAAPVVVQSGAARPDRSDGDGLSWAGWTGVGVGAIGVGLLGAFGLVELGLPARFDELEEAGQAGRRDEFERLEDEIADEQANGRLFRLAGGIAVVSGAALIALDLYWLGEDASVAVTTSGTNTTLRVRW